MVEDIWRMKLVPIMIAKDVRGPDKADSGYLEEMLQAIGSEVILKSVDGLKSSEEEFVWC